LNDKGELMQKITVNLKDVPKITNWLKERSGVAVWKSIDLSRISDSCFTPVLDASGHPMNKPHWKYANAPDYIITSVDDVEVTQEKELKRFHVAVRRSSNGMSMKCTDASSARIKREVEKAGEGAYYEFDYCDEKNCVIMVPTSKVPLKEIVESV
jgi:hypothetical protein